MISRVLSEMVHKGQVIEQLFALPLHIREYVCGYFIAFHRYYIGHLFGYFLCVYVGSALLLSI